MLHRRRRKGRPKTTGTLEELARQYTAEAIHALAASLNDPRTRVAAAIALLDRGYGKPSQSHVLNHSLASGDASDAELLAIALSGGSAVVTSEEEDQNDPNDLLPDDVVH